MGEFKEFEALVSRFLTLQEAIEDVQGIESRLTTEVADAVRALQTHQRTELIAEILPMMVALERHVTELGTERDKIMTAHNEAIENAQVAELRALIGEVEESDDKDVDSDADETEDHSGQIEAIESKILAVQAPLSMWTNLARDVGVLTDLLELD